MSTYSASESKAYTLKRMIGLLLVLLGVAACTAAETMTSANGPFQPYFVGYPPPTLFYLAPLAMLHWPLALALYMGLVILFYVLALLWFSTHAATHKWVQDYRANLIGIAAHGNVSGPGPQGKLENSIIDLQAVVSHYRDEPSFYNRVVWIFSAIRLAVWLYPVIRQPSSLGEIYSASQPSERTVCFRSTTEYNARALLILFPAVALLQQRTIWWDRVATIATVLTLLVSSDWYAHYLFQLPFHQDFWKASPRTDCTNSRCPLTLLAVTIFYLTVLYVSPPRPRLSPRSDGFS